MSDIDKIILKMKRQPNGVRFSELCKVLEHSGYKMKSKKRNIAQKFYKSNWGCDYNKRGKSFEGSVCKRCIKKNRGIEY